MPVTAWERLLSALLGTLWDVLPIVVIVVFFQLAVLRRKVANVGRLVAGFAYVALGLSLFLLGLEMALFPLGQMLARQLVEPEFLQIDPSQLGSAGWRTFGWAYLFAFAIGCSTTMAEPALLAVALKAQDASGGAIAARGLRLAVAFGVGVGVSLGVLRIVLGIPLLYFILPGYLFVVLQTRFAPKQIIPLAYDSGGVTTSTVTVPILAALGLGLAETLPGRDPLLDGFGLIAFASLFPIIFVMGYAQIAAWLTRRGGRRRAVGAQLGRGAQTIDP
jgi:hypothetical protein